MVRKELPERKLQQYLPFTVLKPGIATAHQEELCFVATVLTVYGIETQRLLLVGSPPSMRCNSTYRLWYMISG